MGNPAHTHAANHRGARLLKTGFSIDASNRRDASNLLDLSLSLRLQADRIYLVGLRSTAKLR